MKDYDAIARKIKDNAFDPWEFDKAAGEYSGTFDLAECAAILRKHDEAEASGEHPMALPRTLAGGVTKFISIRRDSEGDACGWNFETEKAAQWIAAQLAQSQPAPPDEKALCEAIRKLPRYAFDMQLGDIFKVGHGAFLKVADIEALLGREAPKDESKEGAK